MQDLDALLGPLNTPTQVMWFYYSREEIGVWCSNVMEYQLFGINSLIHCVLQYLYSLRAASFLFNLILELCFARTF